MAQGQKKMSNECDKCGLKDPECQCFLTEVENRVTNIEKFLDRAGLSHHGHNNLSKLILKRIEAIGIAREKIRVLITDDMFDGNRLSKHNPYWTAQYSEAEEKLWDLRSNLICVQDALSEICDVLDGDD